MKITEENYVSLMKKRNEKALEYFINKHGWIVKSIIQKKMQRYPQEQHECMNDVFLSIWNHVNEYDEIKGSFQTYVAAITRYRIIDYMRRLTPAFPIQDIDDLEIPSDYQISANIEEEEMRQEFLNLIKCLNKADQILFTKLFLEEATVQEISDEMNIKPANLYNRISRGRSKLRKTLKEDNQYAEYLRLVK